MNFSNYPVKQFCDEVYAINGNPFSTSEISSLDMYQYIREKTNNFDFDSLSYLISDIRNYYENIIFSFRNPKPKPEIKIDQYTGYPTSESQELIDNYETFLNRHLSLFLIHLEFNLDLDYTENQTLREKVDIFKKALPEASFIHDISNLLKFSDIAEKEYERVSSLAYSNVKNDIYIPTIQTIWNNKEELTSAYHRFNKLLNCDLKTWLFWFGGYPIEKPDKIKWIYKDGNKRALTYFIEEISLSKKIDFAKSRKIFDIQVYSKDKYEYTFDDISILIG